jgi:hypothetical protein
MNNRNNWERIRAGHTFTLQRFAEVDASEISRDEYPLVECFSSQEISDYYSPTWLWAAWLDFNKDFQVPLAYVQANQENNPTNDNSRTLDCIYLHLFGQNSVGYALMD